MHLMQVHAGYGTRLIFILIQEYGIYYITKVEIVDLELIHGREDEGEQQVGECLASLFRITLVL